MHLLSKRIRDNHYEYLNGSARSPQVYRSSCCRGAPVSGMTAPWPLQDAWLLPDGAMHHRDGMHGDGEASGAGDRDICRRPGLAGGGSLVHSRGYPFWNSYLRT
jgi:hypothetical protein